MCLPSRRVWVDPAFDLGHPLLVTVHHSNNRYRATDQNRNDRYQKRPKVKDSIDHFHASSPKRCFGQRPSTNSQRQFSWWS
jgi:hypothetical protein